MAKPKREPPTPENVLASARRKYWKIRVRCEGEGGFPQVGKEHRRNCKYYSCAKVGPKRSKPLLTTGVSHTPGWTRARRGVDQVRGVPAAKSANKVDAKMSEIRGSCDVKTPMRTSAGTNARAGALASKLPLRPEGAQPVQHTSSSATGQHMRAAVREVSKAHSTV